MVYRLLEHDDEFLVKLLCGWCDISRNGLFVALVNRRLRDVVHLATRYEQRRRLTAFSWPGHDSEDPLPGYVPRYRTVCQLAGCFLTESRMLYVFEHLAEPGTYLHELLWQQGSVDDRCKRRFDDAVARCYPYDPRQRQASTSQHMLMHVAAYRMTYRSLNAMLDVASLRCIRRCFLEILGGHRVCTLHPYEAHDRCLLRFAGRHGRVDVLDHLLTRDPSKGLSFDFAEGLAEAFRALLRVSDALDLGPERTADVLSSPVTDILNAAAAYDSFATLAWFQKRAEQRLGWTPSPCRTGPRATDLDALLPLTFFTSRAHRGVSNVLLGTMLRYACANNQGCHVLWQLGEVVLHPALEDRPSDLWSKPEEMLDWMVRFCLWAFVVLATRPTDVRSLQLLVSSCLSLHGVLPRLANLLLNNMFADNAGTPMTLSILQAKRQMQFGEEFGRWDQPEGIFDLRRLVVLVNVVLPLKLPSLIRHLGWDRHKWLLTEQTLFSCTAQGSVLKLIVDETEESIGMTVDGSGRFPAGRRNGWFFHSWRSIQARQDSSMMMLRNDIDPEGWNAMRTLTHHWLRELYTRRERSMPYDESRLDSALQLSNCYRFLGNTPMYQKTLHPNFGDPLSRPWLVLDVAAYAVIPEGTFLDGKSNFGNRVGAAQEAIGTVFGLWWEATSDTFDTHAVDSLSACLVQTAPCPVYGWFSRFVKTLDHEARRRAESQFGQLVLYALDLEIASVPRITVCNVALMALAGWAERQGHIPEDLITKFLTTLRDRESPEERCYSSLAHRVLNRPDPHASPTPHAVAAATSEASGRVRVLPDWMRAGRKSERAVFGSGQIRLRCGRESADGQLHA